MVASTSSFIGEAAFYTWTMRLLLGVPFLQIAEVSSSHKPEVPSIKREVSFHQSFGESSGAHFGSFIQDVTRRSSGESSERHLESSQPE